MKGYKHEKFKCESAECRKHNYTAKIVRRYRDHEYRYCPHCNTKYLTHKDENGEIVIDNHWNPVARQTYNKF